MRPGGGSVKGSEFERWLGKQLSQWITLGDRTDLFSRNVLSGGRFTLTQKKGEASSQPGDLIAADPLAFPLLSVFTIEAKHLKDIGLEAFIYAFGQKRTPLGDIIALANKQAKSVGKHSLVIARQNNRDILVFASYSIATQISYHGKRGSKIVMHAFNEDSIMAFRFVDMLNHIPAAKLIKAVRSNVTDR